HAGIVAGGAAELAADDLVDDVVDGLKELRRVTGAVVAGDAATVAVGDRLGAGHGHLVEGVGVHAARAVEADDEGVDGRRLVGGAGDLADGVHGAAEVV